MNPVLVTALAEDRHRRCPCGVVTQQPYRVCRNCDRRHRLEVQDCATAPSRRSLWHARLFRNAAPFARALSLIQSSSKGRQN
jgi:hypothetical protein